MDNDEMLQQIAQMIERQTEQLKAYVDKRQRETIAYVEQTTNRRLDALFDGYQAAHEKLFELEGRTAQLEQQVQDVERKIG
jgi:predicted  nucleic acid-binding Zn-ribbon protein